jgi:hypothetical protein
MKRLATSVRGAGLSWRSALTILVVGLLTVSVGCGAVDYWVMSTWINETDVPVYVTNNNSSTTVLRPQEKHSFPGGFSYREPGAPATLTYTIRAYEFLPGKGDIPGWFETPGSPVVLGGQGDLLFTKTYTQEEIETMNYTVTITRNVFPGQPTPGSSP